MKKSLSMLLVSTMLLGGLAACSSEEEGAATATPDVTVGQDVSTEPSTENVEIEFVLPEEFTGVEENIAKAVVSVQNTPDFLFVPNMQLEESMLADMYGISSDLYTDFYGCVPMMSQQIDQILVFKAPDTQTALLEALDGYLTTQRENQSQYPATLDKLEVTTVETVGDYVFLNGLSSYPENEAEMSHEEMMAFYEETIASVTAEMKRVLEGGEPNPMLEQAGLEGDTFESDSEEFLGEYQTPTGGDIEVIDPNDNQPATPPDGDMLDDNMMVAPDGVAAMPEMVPEIGEATQGHSADGNSPSVELPEGGQSRSN